MLYVLVNLSLYNTISKHSIFSYIFTNKSKCDLSDTYSWNFANYCFIVLRLFAPFLLHTLFRHLLSKRYTFLCQYYFRKIYATNLRREEDNRMFSTNIILVNCSQLPDVSLLSLQFLRVHSTFVLILTEIFY